MRNMYINNREYSYAMVRNMSDEELAALATNTTDPLVMELAMRLYCTTQPVTDDHYISPAEENQLRRATDVR